MPGDNQGTKTVPCGTPNTTATDLCNTEKAHIHFNVLQTIVAKQFAFKEFMWGISKAFSKSIFKFRIDPDYLGS